MDVEQKNSGNEALQVGHIQGNAHINHHTGPVTYAQVVNHNTHHHHTVHAHGPVHIHAQGHEAFLALQAPPAPPARRVRRAKQVYDISPGQKDLLALMRALPQHVRVQVLDFMRAEFGTGLVMELEPRDVHATRQRVLDLRRSLGITA